MDDYGLDRLLGYIQDRSYIGSGDAPYSGSLSRQENVIPEKGYEPIQGFVSGLADIAGAWASGSDLGMFYDMMGLQPVDGSPNLVKDLSVTLNIDPESIQKTLNDSLAAAGLDQQGNLIDDEDEVTAAENALNPTSDTDETINKIEGIETTNDLGNSTADTINKITNTVDMSSSGTGDAAQDPNLSLIHI